MSDARNAGRKPLRATWESWVEKRIRAGIEDGLFEDARRAIATGDPVG